MGEPSASSSSASAAAASASESADKVICETSDGDRIEVPADVLMISHKFEAHYDEWTKKGGTVDLVFPVWEIKTKAFKKVVDWCEHHKGQPDPVIEEHEDGQRKWFHFNDYERKFLKCPIEELKELIEAARILDVKSLYYYGVQTMANILHMAVRSRKEDKILRTIIDLGLSPSAFC